MAYTLSNGLLTVTGGTEDLYTILVTEVPDNTNSNVNIANLTATDYTTLNTNLRGNAVVSANGVVRYTTTGWTTNNPVFALSRIVIDAGATLNFKGNTSHARISPTVIISDTSATNAKIQINGTFNFGIITTDAQGAITEAVTDSDDSNSLIIVGGLPSAFQGDIGLTIGATGRFNARGGKIVGGMTAFWNAPTGGVFDIVGTDIINTSSAGSRFFKLNPAQAAWQQCRIKNANCAGWALFSGVPVNVFDNVKFDTDTTADISSSAVQTNIYYTNFQMAAGAKFKFACQGNTTERRKGSTVYNRNGPLTMEVRTRQNTASTSGGTVITSSMVNFFLRDPDLAPIPNANFRWNDTNNGARRASATTDNTTNDWNANEQVIHHWNRDLQEFNTTDITGRVRFEAIKTVYNNPLTGQQGYLNSDIPADSRLPIRYKARHYNYNIVNDVLTATSFTQGADTNVYATVALDNNAILPQAAMAAITDITFNKTNRIITVTGNRTLDELYCVWKNWFVQQAQFDTDVVFTVNNNGVLNLNNWAVVGAQFLTQGVNATSLRSTTTVTSDVQGNRIGITIPYLDGSNANTISLAVNGLPANIPTGSQLRVVVLNRTTNAVIFDNVTNNITNTGGQLLFSTNYQQQDIPAVIKIYIDDYKPITANITLIEGGNSYTATPQLSYGITATSRELYQYNGTTRNTAGLISVTTASNVISFDNTTLTTAVDLREALSVLKRKWNDEPGLAAVGKDYPFDFDDVRGVFVEAPWTVNIAANANVGVEGFFTRNGSTITSANVAIYAINSSYPVKGYFTTDGTKGNTFTVNVIGNTGVATTLQSVSTTASNIQLKLYQKIPTRKFITKTFTIKNPTTGKYITNLVNNDINFTSEADTNVTEIVPEATFPGRIIEATFASLDSTNTNRTFARVLEVADNTTTRQQMINQLAALAAYDEFYDEKPFTVEANLRITVAQGSFVRYRNGLNIGGTVTNYLYLRDNNGSQWIYPTQKTVTLTLDPSWTGGNVTYVVVPDSQLTANTGNNPTIQLNSDNTQIIGNLNPNSTSATLNITSTPNVPVKIFVSGVGMQSRFYSATFSDAVSAVTINPAADPVQLYSNTAITTDNTATGVRAWDSAINNITFDWQNRQIIIPDTYTTFDVAKAYRAWKNAVTADVTRLRYGIPMRGENQAKESTAVDNSYLFYPQFSFQWGWKLNVTNTRQSTSALELSAGGLSREDAGAGTLVYVAPMQNTRYPSTRITTGSSSEFQSQTTEALSTLTTTVNNLTTDISNLNALIRNVIE